MGDRVWFSLTSVFLPEPQEPEQQESNAQKPDREEAALPSEPEVEGTILAFSDSGPVPQVFAVVETVQRRTMVVPVEKLRLRPDEDQGGKELA